MNIWFTMRDHCTKPSSIQDLMVHWSWDPSCAQSHYPIVPIVQPSFCIFGIGQPSNPPVAALSPLGRSWFLHDPKSKQSIDLASYCGLFFSRMVTLWEPIADSSHFDRSMSITIDISFAGSGRTAVENRSMNFRHRALSACCNAGVPSNWIMASNSSGDSGSALWGRSNGFFGHWMSSSSSIASSNSSIGMRFVPSVNGWAANGSTWGRRRSCGTSVLSTDNEHNVSL